MNISQNWISGERIWGNGLKSGLAGILLVLSFPVSAAKVLGGAESEALYGTPLMDYYYGGAGADVFVINFLGDDPDIILDLDPAEGDTIELAFPELRSVTLEKGRVSINRKGTISVDLGGGKRVPVVETGRTDLRLEADPRKGRVLLKFRLPLGGAP